MFSTSTRRKADLKLIFRITLAWMVVGILLTIYDYITTSNSEFYLRTEDYSFALSLGINLLGAFLGGITAGSFIVLYSTKKLRKKSFQFYVFVNSFVILILVFLIDLIAVNFVFGVLHETWFQGQAYLDYTYESMFHIMTFRSIGIWFVLALGTTFLLRISEGYGPGIVSDIVTGRYHKPVVEERIFMFLDIKSSTALAEKLGHAKYFQLLSDFFADITDAIVYNEGDIYQYVGDEVVVSWRVQKGLRNNNCLNCFFAAKERIAQQSDNYLDKFGVTPEFKAGLHVGFATVGEIGVLKKTIAFSGDVLNTTSRIQSNCNKFKTDLLVSEELLHKLSIDSSLSIDELGEIELRGRQQKTKLYAIQQKVKT